MGLIGLLLLPLSGQEIRNKKTYTADLDSLWSTNSHVTDLSSDGRWVAFVDVYNHGDRKLFLSKTDGKNRLEFGHSESYKFSGDNNWFAFISSKKELILIDLKTQIRRTYSNVFSFEFSDNGHFITMDHSAPATKKSISVENLQNRNSIKLDNVLDYTWNPAYNLMAINRKTDEKSEILLVDATDNKIQLIQQAKDSSYSNLSWNDSGNSLVFSETLNNQTTIHFYKLNGVKMTIDNALVKAKFPHTVMSNKEILVSDNGNNVFFYRRIEDAEPVDDYGVQIWETTDPWAYPKMKNYREAEAPFLLTLWDTSSNQLKEIADKETPSAKFNPNHSHALVFYRLKYEPQYKEYEDVDVFLKDYQSGKKTRIVEKLYTQNGFFRFSPSGRYFVYFKNDDWWVYDAQKNNTRNLTGNLNESFVEKELYWTKDGEPYGNPGWSDDEKYIILHDKYDVWLMGVDGKAQRKITSGKEKKISYRIWRDDSKYIKSSQYLTSYAYDLKKGILLTMSGDDLQTGYAFWDGKKTNSLIYEPLKVNDALLSSDRNTVVLKKSKYNLPPAIYSFHIAKGSETLLFQSNQELLGYDLGKSEILSYKNPKNDFSKAALLYPANFDPQKKYPMITWIYDNNSVVLNSAPSGFDIIGFNVLKYVTNGYFIFLPDLTYKIGQPGVSATASLQLAINEALKNTFIDKEKLGLIGHSWGGYETSFIVTQTDLFAAAVSGAAANDLISKYHDVAWSMRTEQMWRFENQQYRMGDSFYKIKEKYYRNSPLHQVENIKTPLLLWTGDKDDNVNWTQSVYMYNALKRLNKPGKLLLFNNEGHFIFDKKKQQILSTEIFEWFNRYLK
ncbi:hypothetical protein EB1_25230 [Empedobacter brevis NBRC 14943 = ATCC 43319]|uniref:Peptidase S9 prolyl oligopeptidase catalytic domain-containing protein n=2 Tax=Empedobacter brevis TaxID=247 RepID=A0A511NIX6_9FLAO|nr:hypothetical protein EB1_25230 [Empedobacter brevis NBRC 14943 = ATCC 43319]